MIDGTLISQFLKKWAAFASVHDDDHHHKLDDHATNGSAAHYVPASVLFPSRPAPPSNASAWAGIRSLGEEKLDVERFVFDAKAIASLRDQAKSDAVPNPSAIEVLSGFIWKHMMKASNATSGTRHSI